MRLSILENGHRLRARVFITTINRVFRYPVDPVIRLWTYRPEFFGGAMSDYASIVLRSNSFWTPAEREFFAAYSSEQNQCPFCATIHSETTRVESGGALMAGDAQNLRREAAAMLPVLAKTTRSPELLTRADIDAVRDVGVPDAAIIDALHVNAVFNVMNRVANALDFQWETPGQVEMAAKVLHRVDYRLPRILLR
ncbi:hypothetical protein [Smaragdicoccus niigatensis]|uniref:hypothetical protein n=1 Tax=Smaragdicoccus niigatensis TaxID=359359 RepID=UPI000368D9B6|nr:hypothetical protein [Smaragdicoccus niigatensis]